MREKIAEIIQKCLCDYDDSTPELLPSVNCYEECAKGNWCKKVIPECAEQILDLFKDSELKWYNAGWEDAMKEKAKK
jgi:hypothetical protein